MELTQVQKLEIAFKGALQLLDEKDVEIRELSDMVTSLYDSIEESKSTPFFKAQHSKPVGGGLEVGKVYLTRGGNHVELVAKRGLEYRGSYPFTTDTGHTYAVNGSYILYQEGPLDLVREIGVRKEFAF